MRKKLQDKMFEIRRFLLNRHDMVETPDGLVEIADSEDKNA